MAVGSGAAFTVNFSQVNDMLADLNDAKDALNALDTVKGVRGVAGYSPAGTRMQRELRKQVKVMSDRVIIPALRRQALATGDPLTIAMAATARAKQDRLPIVKVGAVNPKVSGFKRTEVSRRPRARGQLAWGSERGPWDHDAPSGIGRKTGAYARARNPRGYWVYWAISSAAVTRGVIQGYGEVVDAIFDKWRWGPRSGDVTKAA